MEGEIFTPTAAIANARVKDWNALAKRAGEDLEGFWADEEASELEWYRRWDQVLDASDKPRFKWFAGARCNIVHNALDRHQKTWRRNKLAFVWVGENSEVRTYSYFALNRDVCKFANVLKAMGVKKGDRVTIYMPRIPEIVIAMMAVAKLGALQGRIEDSESRVVVTADGGFMNGKVVQLKKIVDDAVRRSPSVETVIVVRRTGHDVKMEAGRDYWYHELSARHRDLRHRGAGRLGPALHPPHLGHRGLRVALTSSSSPRRFQSSVDPIINRSSSLRRATRLSFSSSRGELTMLIRRFAFASLAVAVVAGCSGAAPEPCETVDCGPSGHCASRAGKPECVCNQGFRPEMLSCVAVGGGGGMTDGGSGPCSANPCAATGKVCTESNGFALCTCPAGFADLGSGCVTLSACTSNPCTQPNQNVCYVVDGGPSCLCNPGYQATTGGCSATTTQDAGMCTAIPHTGAGDDTFESDECPTSSKLYSSPQTHSLTTNDIDWIHTPSGPRQILRVTVSGSSIPLSIDVFDSDAYSALAADHTGNSNPSLLVSAVNNLAYARVTAVVGTDTGPYTLTITDAGFDDYVGLASAATTSTGSFNGQIQYTGDEDVVRFTAIAGHSYLFALGSSTPATLAFDVYDVDGVTLRKSLDSTLAVNSLHYARAKTAGSYLVRAKARVAGSTGSYQVLISDLGVDDRGDNVIDADPLAFSSTSANGSFERSGDLDVFTFPVVANRIYRLTCTNGSYGCITAMRDPAGVVVAQQNQNYSSANTISAAATSPGSWNVSLQYHTSGSGPYAYTYQLEDLGPDDYPGSLMTPTSVAIDATTNGRIELAQDRDVFGFNAAAGTIYKVACTSTPASACSATVRDAAGATVGYPGFSPSPTRDVVFKAVAAGLHTIDVTANLSLHYSVVVSVAPADDHGDTAATSSVLTVGAATAGVTNFQGDVDSFTATLTAGKSYQLRCTGDTTTCELFAYDLTSTLVVSGSNAIGVLGTTGTWRFAVAGVSNRGTGSYSLTLNDVGVDDHSDTVTGATALTIGVATGGNIQHASDVDVFTFNATVQRLYQVVCTEAPMVNYVCGLTIRNAGGTSISTASAFSNTPLTFKAPANGSFTIEVRAAGVSYLGGYSLLVTDQGVDDYPDSTALATPITLGPGGSGEIAYAGDRDVVSFTTIANHVHRFTCTTSVSQLCAVTLRNAANAIVTGGTTAGGVTTYIFYTPVAETWTADMGSTGSNTGSYTFQVVDLGLDDHPNTGADAQPFSVGTTNGNLQYIGDVDVFTFMVTAGQYYNFNVTSSPTGFWILVRDGGGAIVMQASGNLGFVATGAGTYTVAFSSSTTTAAGTGGFSVVLSTGTDDAPNSATGAPALTLAMPRNARIDYTSDEDWYAVSLTASTSYTITATAAFTTFLYVYMPDGVTQAAGGGLSFNTKTFSAPSTGTFYVRVAPNTGGTGDYTVRVQ